MRVSFSVLLLPVLALLRCHRMIPRHTPDFPTCHVTALLGVFSSVETLFCSMLITSFSSLSLYSHVGFPSGLDDHLVLVSRLSFCTYGDQVERNTHPCTMLDRGNKNTHSCTAPDQGESCLRIPPDRALRPPVYRTGSMLSPPSSRYCPRFNAYMRTSLSTSFSSWHLRLPSWPVVRT
jgi:hypothetical protein